MNDIIETTRKNLLANYLADQRPWVVAYSGGKDSTLVLQLVYEMLLELKNKNNTFVTPAYRIAGRYGRTIKEMTSTLISSSEEQNLLQKLILDFEIDETCVRELFELTTKIYPDLDYSISGAKSDLTQGIKQIIEKHIEQEALAEAPQ